MTALYVHVPFCENKCGYCSFYSKKPRAGEIDSWLEALELEIISRLSFLKKFQAPELLYIGGGTPSLLSVPQWKKFLDTLKKFFGLTNLIEATVEANPNSLTREHVNFFKANGFTRISLGVQSLEDNELKILGRLHDSEQALKAMELVKNSGLALNCDLIFAVPGQTLRTWASSLKKVIQLADHVSTYQLTLEPDTPLGKKFLNEDLNFQGYKFYRYAQYFLPRKNFLQYEISNFAPAGFECRHNISYWTQEDVIALGPSAVSYLAGVRTKNPGTLEKYFRAAEKNFPVEFLEEKESLPTREKNLELVILSLRTKWGIARELVPVEVLEILDSLPRDLFSEYGERIILSPRGMRLGNAIWSEII